MKPFNQILVELNDGSTVAGLTSDLQKLLEEVQATGRAGAITLTLKVTPAKQATSTGVTDKVTVTAERKLTLPKPDAPTDFYWLTDNAELSRNHPRQQTLELRDVTGSGTVSTNDLKQAT